MKSISNPIILITGTPGTGKTVLARALGEKLNAYVLNEKNFCKKMKTATWNKKLNEWEIDLKKYKKAFTHYSKLHASKPLILEGHVGSEVRLPVSHVILLRCNPTELGYRLASRHYSPLKIQENIYCEATDYVKQNVRRYYSPKPFLEIHSDGLSPAQTIPRIQKWLQSHPND